MPRTTVLADEFGNFITTTGGSLAYPSRDFFLEVARGNITGMSVVNIRGKNLDIDTGTVPESIWPVGGVYTFLSSLSSLEILSDSANDTSAGTGMRTVLVQGLNTSYNAVSETVTLNGTSVVALVNQYFRINYIQGATAGSGNTNAGNITLRVAGAGATVGYISASTGRSQQAIYTVPVDTTAYLVYSTFTMQHASGNFCEFEMQSRTLTTPWLVRDTITCGMYGANFIERRYAVPLSFPEGTDIRVRVTNLSASNVIATATLQFILIDDTLD